MGSPNRLHRAIHTFRQSDRASFLFPTWLKKTNNDSFEFPFLITLRWFFYRFLTMRKPHQLAQELYFRSLLLENRLVHLTQIKEEWQKNIIHRERQEQLDCFEQILNLYFNKTKKTANNLHIFPEIILVMAEALEEADPFLSTQETATNLITCYENLRSFLQAQTHGWYFHKIELQENDPIISFLLRFKNTWDVFRDSHLVQIIHPNDQHPLLENIVSKLEQSQDNR
jgi:hypothetical protein